MERPGITMRLTCGQRPWRVIAFDEENFEMKEEYFMNYDFLRKHGEKIDKNRKCFRMLDFEDGGMYFGIVEDELPSGLGAFVYSDLKFHCGYYRGGLMNDMSRIHFGNGDVFDGMTENGKMHGEGFFFDCENNDWVFGMFKSDNCVEVIEHGEGFPRPEISKFRSLYHQSAHHYYGRETEPLLLDLDLLIEYANRDISHLRPETIPNSIRGKPSSHHDENNFNEEIEAEEGEEEEPQLDEDESSSIRPALYQINPSKHQGLASNGFEEEIPFEGHLGSQDDKKSVGRDHGSRKKDAFQTKRIQLTSPPGDNIASSGYNSRKVESDFNPIERRMTPVPEVNTVSPSLLEAETLRTPMKGGKEALKKTPGNQIVQGANLIKPKVSQNHKEMGSQVGPDSEIGLTQHSKLSNNMKMNDISGVSSVRDKDESRDLRNISIQTEDKLTDTYYKNDEASISYLKGIHSMIDELKQMVSDKIVVGRETEKVEESILFKITEVKKQVEQSLSAKPYPPFLDRESPVLPFQTGSVLSHLNMAPELGADMQSNFKSEGSGLPPETRIPISFNSAGSTEISNFWNLTIDRQLEEKRLKDIEEALAKKFGKSDDHDKQHIEVLEPIKESPDGEDDDEINNLRNSKSDFKGSTNQRLNLGGMWEGSLKEGLLEGSPAHNPEQKPKSESSFGQQSFGQPHKPDQEAKAFEPRITPRDPIQEVITEADEKTFYTGEPLWGEDRRKSSWARTSDFNKDDNSQNAKNVKSIEAKAREDNGKASAAKLGNDLEVENMKVDSTEGNNQIAMTINLEKSLSFGRKGGQSQPSGTTLQAVNQQDFDQNRDSNFMYSRRGNETGNNGSLLPGLQTQLAKGSSVMPWFFLNPYLYEATFDVDMNHY
jgi:hypothetical protein